MEGFEKRPVDAGGRLEAGDSGEERLTASVEGEAVPRGDIRERRGMGPFLLVGGVDERKPPGHGPPGRFSVPLGEARPDVPDTLLSGRRGDLGKKGQVGADGSPVLPEENGVEPDRYPQGAPGEGDAPGELAQGLPQRRRAGFDGRPAEPRDREMEIDLVVGREQVLQPVIVPEEVRKVLRPEDDRVDRIGGQVDLAGEAPRAEDTGPPVTEGSSQPIRERRDEVRAPGGADDGFQDLIPVRGRAGRRASRRGRT